MTLCLFIRLLVPLLWLLPVHFLVFRLIHAFVIVWPL